MGNSKKPLGARAIDALASVKLSLFLFLTLAGTSIFGTVIQQQADPGAYLDSYGTSVAEALRLLNLVDMYHSWWFQLLLALLLANTLVCSLRRLPSALRSIRPDQFPEADELAAKSFSASWEGGDLPDEAVEASLRATLGAPRVRTADGAATWFVQKRAWARLGAYVCHGSLVLFFVGAIVGARYGFKGQVQIPEGGAVDSVELRGGGTLKLPFTIRCDEFELQNYPDGRPKDYLSALTVLRDGRVVQRKRIEVNSPLIQDGIFFYQSSYGKTGGGAILRVLTRDGRLLTDGLRVPAEGAAPVPGTNTSVEVLATTEDLQGQGPAAQLTLLDNSGDHAHAGQPFVVVEQLPGMDVERGGELIFQLAGLDPGSPYTGLQVARDPGVPLIWAGAVLLTLGTCMAFFFSHRRIWVRREGTRLTLAGSASRDQEAFRDSLAALASRLQDQTPEPAPQRAAV